VGNTGVGGYECLNGFKVISVMTTFGVADKAD